MTLASGDWLHPSSTLQSALVLFAVSLLSFVLVFLSHDSVAALVPLNGARQRYGQYSPPVQRRPTILSQYVPF